MAQVVLLLEDEDITVRLLVAHVLGVQLQKLYRLSFPLTKSTQYHNNAGDYYGVNKMVQLIEDIVDMAAEHAESFQKLAASREEYMTKDMMYIVSKVQERMLAKEKEDVDKARKIAETEQVKAVEARKIAEIERTKAKAAQERAEHQSQKAQEAQKEEKLARVKAHSNALAEKKEKELNADLLDQVKFMAMLTLFAFVAWPFGYFCRIRLLRAQKWKKQMQLEQKRPPEDVSRALEKVKSANTEGTSPSSSFLQTCTFYFVPADYLRVMTEDQAKAIPTHKDLLANGTLKEFEFSFPESVATERFRNEFVAISHPWGTPAHPDPKGTQMSAIIEYLKCNREVKYLWFDYFCMPQGERTEDEKAYMKKALGLINMLYLGCHVAILLNLQYSNRFWCLFESFLAMHECGPKGLVGPRPEGGKRFTIIPIEGADEAGEEYSEALEATWSRLSTEQAFKHLRNDDIQVTNLRDKEIQLEKLIGLERAIQDVFTTLSSMGVNGRG